MCQRIFTAVHVTLVCEQVEDFILISDTAVQQKTTKNVNSGSKMLLHSVFFSFPQNTG